MKRVFLTAASLLCLLFLAVAPAAAEDTARVMLVLDASGSMWGQIEGRSKIEIAREVLEELLAEWDPTIHLGLTAYGHRRKGDCGDIEVLVPPGKADTEGMTKKINALSPKGKTPLSEAVRQAAAALAYTEERAAVVLVSDGLETCDADPCAVAAELAMSGVDFTVHVIGFDIRKEEEAALRCLADNTGGLFLAAADARTLGEALSETVAEVKEAPAPVVEDPGEATLEGPGQVPAGSTFEVKWQGPDSRGDYVCIVEEGAGESRYINYAYTIRGNPAHVLAPDTPGAHELRYVHGHTRKVIGRTGIEVTPVTAEVQVPAEAAAGSEFQVAWQGPDNPGDYLTVVAPDAGDSSYGDYAHTAAGSPATLRAPSKAGTWEVRYVMGRSHTVLARGELTTTGVGGRLTVPEVVTAGEEFQAEWEGPDYNGDYVTVVPPDASPSKYMSYAGTDRGSPSLLNAPSDPGTYEVRYIMYQDKKILARAALTVTPVSATVSAPPEAVAGAPFQVQWKGPGYKSDYVTVVPPDASASKYMSYAGTDHGSPSLLNAPSDPGTYEVRYIMYQDKKILARAALTVTPVSATVSAPPEVIAGNEFQVEWSGPDYGGDYVTVVPPAAAPSKYMSYAGTSRGSPATLTAPKEAGEYEVRYVMYQDKKILAVTPLTVK